MAVRGINHINIRTPNYAETLSFLNSVLGMTVSVIGGQSSTERGAWVLDGNGLPILHLARSDVAYSPQEVLPDPPPRGSGAIHHVALTCTDYAGMKARIESCNISFRENVQADGTKQIFVKDPSGISFELNFQQD